MASSTTTTLFIIFLITTTTTTALDTTTITVPPSPSPSSTPSLPSPPPPPPPPPPPTLQDQPQQHQFNTIIDAIIGAGDFSNWANLLSQTDPSIFPLSATLLVPDDAASANSTSDPLLFTYHIIPRRFTFSELCLFPTGARLPTLLPGNTLIVTNNSALNFTINGARITRPDIYHNAVVAVHGVSGVLDYTHFGKEKEETSPPEKSPPEVPPMVDIFVAPANPTFAPMSIQSPMSPMYPSPTYPVLNEGITKSMGNSLSRSFLEFYLCFMVALITLFLGER